VSRGSGTGRPRADRKRQGPATAGATLPSSGREQVPGSVRGEQTCGAPSQRGHTSVNVEKTRTLPARGQQVVDRAPGLEPSPSTGHRPTHHRQISRFRPPGHHPRAGSLRRHLPQVTRFQELPVARPSPARIPATCALDPASHRAVAGPSRDTVRGQRSPEDLTSSCAGSRRCHQSHSAALLPWRPTRTRTPDAPRSGHFTTPLHGASPFLLCASRPGRYISTRDVPRNGRIIRHCQPRWRVLA
jgi:hypothetical protein